MTVRTLYNFIDEIAPFCNQDPSDNSGLLVGDYEAKVSKVLVSLDLTRNVAREAVDTGVDLIIIHHPYMHRPVSEQASDDLLSALASNNINLIAAHTNMDVAVGGIADIMLEKLEFPKSDTVILPINPDGTGYGRIVKLTSPTSAVALAEKCKIAFGCKTVCYTDSGKPITKIGVTSGSAEESVETALNAGCDAFICGEVCYDRTLFATDHSLTLIEAGHFHTEDIFCDDLVRKLKTQFKEIGVEKSVNSVDVCEYVI